MTTRRRTERRLAHVFADSDQKFAAKRYAGRRHLSLAAESCNAAKRLTKMATVDVPMQDTDQTGGKCGCCKVALLQTEGCYL